jgi:hypothetical protein
MNYDPHRCERVRTRALNPSQGATKRSRIKGRRAARFGCPSNLGIISVKQPNRPERSEYRRAHRMSRMRIILLLEDNSELKPYAAFYNLPPGIHHEFE